MTTSNTYSGKRITALQLMRREVLLASLLPATAVFLVGIVGLRQMSNAGGSVFLIVFLVAAAVVFFSERTLILSMQRGIHKQLAAALVAVPPPVPAFSKAGVHDVDALDDQIKQVVREILPALQGDLRVRATASEGSMSLVAEAYNEFILRLAQFARWTLYIIDQVTYLSRWPQEYTFEMTNTLEAQLEHLAQTGKAAHKLEKSLQRMGTILQFSIDIVQKAYAPPSQEKHAEDAKSKTQHAKPQEAAPTTLPPPPDGMPKRLHLAVQKQIQALEEVIHSTQGANAIAKSVRRDVTALEQELQQARDGLLKSHEQVKRLAKLATDWRTSAATLKLPAEQ